MLDNKVLDALTLCDGNLSVPSYNGSARHDEDKKLGELGADLLQEFLVCS